MAIEGGIETSLAYFHRFVAEVTEALVSFGVAYAGLHGRGWLWACPVFVFAVQAAQTSQS